MPTITKSIGTIGRDYSTITAWEADLDNGALYASGDDAVGETYNDSAFDESVTIDGGGTVGLASVTLTVAAGERHDGTAGTGARIVRSSLSAEVLTFGANTLTKALQWLELDLSSAAASSRQAYLLARHNAGISRVTQALMHGAASVQSLAAMYYVRLRALSGTTINNSIIYDTSETFTGSGGERAVVENDGNAIEVYNVTINDANNANSNGTMLGVKTPAGSTVKNTVATDITGTSSGSCFSAAGTVSHNASSDATASGTGSLTSITTADQFVSIVAGSEDLHLKSGADVIDAGTDLGTTPTGVNIDIDGRDRDAEADTWDIGADEFVDAGGGGAAVPQSIIHRRKRAAVLSAYDPIHGNQEWY